MKQLLFFSMVLTLAYAACSKSGSSTSDNNSTIQKQIVNTKWFFDSTVFWHRGSGFEDLLEYDGNNQKTYLYFREDSIMTEYYWTGITYDKTEYPYVWNGDQLVCDYDFINDFPLLQIKNNQLIFGEVPTLPRQTDTTEEVELLWWYYHK